MAGVGATEFSAVRHARVCGCWCMIAR